MSLGMNMHGGRVKIAVGGDGRGNVLIQTPAPPFDAKRGGEIAAEVDTLVAKLPGHLTKELSEAQRALAVASDKRQSLIAERQRLQTSTDERDLRGLSRKWGELTTSIDRAQGDVDDAERLVDALTAALANQRNAIREQSSPAMSRRVQELEAEAAKVRDELALAVAPYVRRLIEIQEVVMRIQHANTRLSA